jgi:glycosyltransferase involved in cell wall biosynthesis
MPVHNGAATLRPALDALRAQTFTDFEVIISDNASTDATEEICRAYAARDPRIRYERNAENLGAAGNFNRVFARARGTYFKWFACDDLLAPEYLERCVRALDEAGPAFVLAFADRGMLSTDGVRLGHDPYLISGGRDDERRYDDIGFATLLRVCGSRYPIFAFALMRRAAMARTRGMGNYIAADLVFVAEMRLFGRFRRVPEVLYFQRLHAPTPEVLARTRKRGDAAWFDPRRQARWPELKLLAEIVQAIRRSDQPALDKARCFVALGGHVATRAHRWSALTWRRLRGGTWRAWTQISTALVAAERVTALPLRVWVLASGMRRGKADRMRLGFSMPWFRRNPRLLAFAAERLARRDDPGAVRLLVAWVMSGDAVREACAASVLADSSATVAPAVADALVAMDASAEAFAATIARHARAADAECWRAALSANTRAAKQHLSRPYGTLSDYAALPRVESRG